MFNRPYSIYIDKRPMRIAFLVNPESTSLEEIDQIIDYNRSLWGGRFNPIILTNGHDITPKWWQFLRDIDPDVIKPLVSLAPELIGEIEDFLSPLIIEPFHEDPQSTSRTRIDIRNPPAGMEINSVNSSGLKELYGRPTLGIFNLDEMDDDIGRSFVLRNFGTYKPADTRSHTRDAFCVPRSLKRALERGEVPSEIQEGFKNAGVLSSNEVFSKKSVQHGESWAIIDKVNDRIHYVNLQSNDLSVQPQIPRLFGELSGINKKVCLITDRESLATALLELARTPNVVFRDQMCGAPNAEREIEEITKSVYFEVIVGDTLLDIVYFWNNPLSIEKWKQQFPSQFLLPPDLAKDTNMEDALCAWIRRTAYWISETPKTVRFVSFSTEKRELEYIANGFQRKLEKNIVVKCFKEPQVPNFWPEDPLLMQIGHGMDIRRTHGNEAVLELAEPRELAAQDANGHWMADFYIEFIPDGYRSQEEAGMMASETLYWRLPNRNYLARDMFDKPSRIQRNGFPSVMMRMKEKVLGLTLAEADSVVSSLFYRFNHPEYDDDPRSSLVVSSYESTEESDKGKYLLGVLELFGNLAFANDTLRNPTGAQSSMLCP